MELAPVSSSTNAGENGVSQFVKFIFLKVFDNITNKHHSIFMQNVISNKKSIVIPEFNIFI